MRIILTLLRNRKFHVVFETPTTEFGFDRARPEMTSSPGGFTAEELTRLMKRRGKIQKKKNSILPERNEFLGCGNENENRKRAKLCAIESAGAVQRQ